MSDVFVSYKAEDRRRVQPLVQALQADGLSVWWDEHIGAGDAWRETIEQQLDSARCVVVVWSKRSVGADGKFVREEASRAQRRGVYVPVLIDAVDPPLGFGESQATSLRGWHGDRSDLRYESVLAAVRRNVGDDGEPHVRPGRPVVINRRAMIAGGTAVAVGAAAGGWFVFRPKATAASNRIAVLPFANLSGDPAQAYFSDGIAEELRSSLSRVGLEVIGRASCDAVKNLDIKTAAAKLGVANILTGSVRRSSQTIRINAQLVSGSDGVERWSESYDRPADDVLKVQTDIAENVAQALSFALGQAGKAALTLGGTSNPAALDLLLQVIHDFADTETGYGRKLALLDAALRLDPNYAEAYARKAYALSQKMGYYANTAEANRRAQAEALAIANRAVAIAPNMALGYAVRAVIYARQLQIGLALTDAKHGLTLPGDKATVLERYALLLARVGQFEEALRLNAKTISLDPLSPIPYAGRAEILYFARRYAEAVTSAQHSLQITPDQDWIRTYLGDALLAQGKSAEAGAEYQKLDPLYYGRLVGEATIAARAGQRAQAVDKLRALESSGRDTDHYQYAEIYAQLGQVEDALGELELAWEVRDPGFAYLRVDPFLDPLRKDLRFAALERKIGVN